MCQAIKQKQNHCCLLSRSKGVYIFLQVSKMAAGLTLDIWKMALVLSLSFILPAQFAHKTDRESIKNHNRSHHEYSVRKTLQSGKNTETRRGGTASVRTAYTFVYFWAVWWVGGRRSRAANRPANAGNSLFPPRRLTDLQDTSWLCGIRSRPPQDTEKHMV